MTKISASQNPHPSRGGSAGAATEGIIGTAQTKVLAHRGIHTIDAANDFLTGEFFSFWEARYTVQPALPDDLHRPIAGYDQDAILCEHEERVVTNDYTFQWQGWRYQIDPKDVISNMRRGKVTIEIRHNDSIKVNFKGRYINFNRIKKANR